MNKSELISAVADSSGLSKADSGRAVDSVIDAITAALAGGDKVSLVGFGNFMVQERAARTGRNPATGAAVEIPAKKLPKFKPGAALKDAVNG